MDNLLIDVEIAALLADYSGKEWEKCDTGWVCPDTGHVFKQHEILGILSATTMQLAGVQ